MKKYVCRVKNSSRLYAETGRPKLIDEYSERALEKLVQNHPNIAEAELKKEISKEYNLSLRRRHIIVYGTNDLILRENDCDFVAKINKKSLRRYIIKFKSLTTLNNDTIV